MRTDRFQAYIDTVKSLLEGEPKRITYIMSKSSTNETDAKKILAVATMKGDVKEIKLGGKSKYATSDKGIILIKEYTPFKDFSDRLEDAFKKLVIK